jgi:hypothetical protein
LYATRSVYCILQVVAKALNILNSEFLLNNIKPQSVPHRKHYVSTTKTSRLMLFRETPENPTKHRNTLCAQEAEFLYVKAGGTYSDHWDLKG